MSRRRRVLAGLFVLGFALLNAMAWMHARAMTHFVSAGERTAFPEKLSFAQKLRVLATGVTVPRPANARDPRAVGLPFTGETFTSADGVRLGAWRIAGAAGQAVVAMFHGYAGCKADLLDEAALLHGLGVELVLTDFRGSGDSAGDSTTIGLDEARDVAAVAGALRGPRKLVLLGQSMGAAAILRAVAVHGVAPDGLIAEAPFDRLVSTIGNRFTAMGLPAAPFDHLLVLWGSVQIGANGFAHDPAEYASRVRCPALVLNGDRDRRVSVEQVHHVYDALPGRKRLKIFTETGHLLYTKNHASEWREEVRGLLAEASGTATW